MSQGPVCPVTRKLAGGAIPPILKAGKRLSSKQEHPVPCDELMAKSDSFCRKEQK